MILIALEHPSTSSPDASTTGLRFVELCLSLFTIIPYLLWSLCGSPKNGLHTFAPPSIHHPESELSFDVEGGGLAFTGYGVTRFCGEMRFVLPLDSLHGCRPHQCRYIALPTFFASPLEALLVLNSEPGNRMTRNMMLEDDYKR